MYAGLEVVCGFRSSLLIGSIASGDTSGVGLFISSLEHDFLSRNAHVMITFRIERADKTNEIMTKVLAEGAIVSLFSGSKMPMYLM